MMKMKKCSANATTIDLFGFLFYIKKSPSPPPQAFPLTCCGLTTINHQSITEYIQRTRQDEDEEEE